MLRKLLQLFIAMAKVGILGYGGGQAMVPVMELETVQNLSWLSTQEFGDAYALGNTLPGPIITKMAAYVGYRQAGVVGAVIGVLGVLLPSVVAMVVLTAVFLEFKDLPQIKGLLRGLRPVIMVLLMFVTFKIGKGALISTSSYVIAGLALIAIGYFKVHPVFVILASMAFGAVFLAK